MNAAVVYESSFGNTRAVAEAIAAALGAELYTVDDDPPALDELDVLVLGGPTHVHGLSSRTSRKAALDQGAEGEAGIGVRGFLEQLPTTRRIRAAAFDTRVDKPALVVGSAARGIAKRLQRHGFTLVAPPESFFVAGTPGPLAEHELERAAEWGRSVAEAVERSAATV